MKCVLRIRQALTERIIEVREIQRLRDVATARSIAEIEGFAVCTDDGSFLGIVSPQEAALFPGRIFADLLTRRPPPLLPAEDPLDLAVQFFIKEKVERAGVSDTDGRFLGVISRASVLEALFMREHKLAYYDVLTGLRNRVFLQERLERLIGGKAASPAPFALAFIDLDNFKTINDALGHRTGDQVLAEIGRRLDSARGPRDIICRFGGDEFVALIIDFDDEERLHDTVRRIFAALNGPVAVDGEEIFVTGSLGISRFPRDAEDAETMLRHADLAMYRAKHEGREQFHYYQEGMATDAARAFHLHGQLRQAYENGQFWLAWQPQVNLASGAIVGAEVLMRCTTPETGPLPPATFIPIAEQSGLIVSLGEWTFQTVGRELAAGLAELLPPGFRIAINLSMSQLNTSIMRAVMETAETIRANGLRLEVELTESALMQASGVAEAFIGELARQEIEIAVDDFGTGYSNLTRLRDLPVNRLKIAPSFTSDLNETGSRSAKIIAGIVALSRALAIEVTAEGVERPEQAELLRQMGCDHAQGYWYARPMPAAEFAASLRLADTGATVTDYRQARRLRPA